MNKKIVILIVIILFVIIGLLVFQYIWLPSKESEKSEEYTVSEETTEEETTEEETTEEETTEEETTEEETPRWKSYKDKQFNFEIQYPNDWYYHVSNFEEVNRKMICFNPDTESEDFCIIPLMIDWDTSFQEMYTTTLQMVEQEYSFTESSASINNIECKIITTDAKTGLSKYLFFERNGHVYNFAMEVGYNSIFNQIISTLEF